jgi:glycosyltransferase involved in cell wall biosynthesis
MADNRDPVPAQGAVPPVGHVLHVAEQDVCLRFGPMLTQVWQGLCASGVRTSVVTDDEEMMARLAGTPIACHWRRHLSGWRAWDFDEYLRAYVDPRPQLAHLWGTAGLWRLRRWSLRSGVPLLVHALGAAHVARLLRGSWRDDQYIVFSSRLLATPLLTRFPTAAGRCFIARPAIAPPPRPPSQLPPGHTFSVLCAAPLSESRGLGVLIDAVAELRRASSDVHVAVVGRGRRMTAVWRRMRARHVQGAMSLVDDPRLWERVLPHVDAYVVPGPQRELSIVPLLAMGLGKLVIAARDQPAEWFVEDRTAWQFTPGSAVELAYLMMRAIEQPQRARELGSLAAEYVHAHCSVHELVGRLVGLYEALWRRKRETPSASREKSNGSRRAE